MEAMEAMEAMASMLAGCVGGIRMRGTPGVPEPVGEWLGVGVSTGSTTAGSALGGGGTWQGSVVGRITCFT